MNIRKRRRKRRRIAKKVQKLVITNAALKLALDNDIDIENMKGTGSKGNIIFKDVKAAIKLKKKEK